MSDWRAGARRWFPAAGVVAALALVPFWNRSPGLPDQAYVGRGAILFLALAAAINWRVLPSVAHRLQIDAAVVAMTALLALTAWTLARAASDDCLRCAGSAAGLSEFVVVAFLVALLASTDAEVRRIAIPATLISSTLAIFTSAPAVVRFWHPTGEPGDGRLSGLYGNPNLLGFIVACGVPALVAFRNSSTWSRVTHWSGVAVACALILMTFSRSAILMAFIGTFVVLFGESRTHRSIMKTGASCIVTGAALFAAYPSFQSWRQDVSFRSLRDAARTEDGSGWDRGRRGPITQGPSEIAIVNDDGRPALEVRTDRVNEGVSFEWGALEADQRYTIVLRARSARATRVRVVLGDLASGATGVPTEAVVGRNIQDVRVGWSPMDTPTRARAYVVFPSGAASLRISVLRLEMASAVADRRARIVAVAPMALKGPPSAAELRRRFADPEASYAASRAKGLRLAAQAVRSRPLLGIGWEQFPSYAARNSRYGLLATHNEYARFAAELGLPGLFLLVGALGAGAVAARRHANSAVRLAAIGIGVTSATGFAFANALVSPSLSLPLAVTLGWVCRRE